MDKFEQTVQQMEKMSQQESANMIESKKKLCICPECPTYTDCARKQEERLYCIVGKSPSCITEEVECICPTCPVTEELGLTNMYFCIRGTEKEQRGM